MHELKLNFQNLNNELSENYIYIHKIKKKN